jgi:hypothetical protein
MNEFLPRAGAVTPVISATERSTSPVRAVPATKSIRGDGGSASEWNSPAYERERSAAAASYAKIQAEIANVLADLKPSSSAGAETATNRADRAIMALMPNPVVMLPLPPTDEQMVAFVAQVAQTMARQAAQAHAAQASVTPIMVEAAAH